jgi:hypothetical protein
MTVLISDCEVGRRSLCKMVVKVCWLHFTYCNWLNFGTSCVFYSACVSLWGLRSYLGTYVNFKVMYIGRESDVIVTCFVGAFVSSVALRVECGVMNWYRRLVLNGTWFIEPRASKLSVAKLHTRYCGWCPPVAAPCRKQNCTLNRLLGTLQLSRAALIVNVVSVAVL